MPAKFSCSLSGPASIACCCGRQISLHAKLPCRAAKLISKQPSHGGSTEASSRCEGRS